MRLKILVGLAIPISIAACGGGEWQAVDPLVDASWLADNLETVVVLDIRERPSDEEAVGHDQAHIPGAVHAPYREFGWRTTRDDVPGMMPEVEQLATMVGELGISADDHVVIVGGGGSSGDFAVAARVYWQLEVMGHEAQSILDGGHTAWEAQGLPVESEPTSRPPAQYEAQPRLDLVALKSDVERAVEAGSALVDARTDEFYRGLNKSGVAARPGTIRGAKSIPHPRVLAEDGAVVSPDEAQAVWEAAGVSLEGEQIAFCNTGQQGAAAWFVAYAVLGNEEARLYDGSLAEWSADESAPMEPAVDGGS